MFRFASLALCAVLGAAAVAHSSPVQARPLVAVGIGLPAAAVVPPFVAYAPPYLYPAYVPLGYRYAYRHRWGYWYGPPYIRR